MVQKPISQIKLPNGSTYNIDKGIYYIEGTGSTDTTNKVATWLGSHNDIPAYYNGLTILYKISTAGSTKTTLNINNLGAISVVKNVNSAISTSYGVNSIVALTYTTDGTTAYWKCADYDANTKTTTGTSNKASTKLFLTGATSQTSSGTTTYSNSKVYIGTDNCLYSNGNIVITPDTDNYHTTGSWNGLTYTATANGGAGELKFTVPTGTSSTTVAVGNHTHSSYVNQNAFSNVKVGDTTVAADTTTDTLTLVGSNVTLTPDTTNDKITIGITKANVTAALGYTPPTTDTNTHYTTKLFATSSTGTAHAVTTNGNTYLRLFDDSTARQSIKITGSGATTVTSDANGVITISSSKFSGNYNDLTNKPTIPTVPTSLKNPNSLTIQGNGTTSFTYDGSAAKTLNIKAGSNVTVSSDKSGNITIAATNTTYTFNGAVSTIKDNNLTANRALISDSKGKVAVSAVTSTELGYLDGVTSSIQTQLNGKLGSTATAAAASKVTNKLTIKLNSGSTEGTNLFTFDGSAAKTLNITASSIGAAPAYTYQTTDPGAGSSLTTGKLLIVYS